MIVGQEIFTTNSMKIVFTADDYGESQETNQKIAEICQSSIVNSATVLAFNGGVLNKEQFLNIPDMSWGAHLYLTEYAPLTNRLRKLAGTKSFFSKGDIVKRLLFGTISAQDIYEEFTAQFKRISDNFKINFVDTHQNIHGLPVIFPIVKKIASDYGLREAIRPFAQLDFNFKGGVKIIFSKVYSGLINFKPNTKVLVNCPGYEEPGIDLDKALESWDRFLYNIQNANCQEILIPCHPGSSPAEIKLYTSEEFEKLLKSHKVRFNCEKL